MSASQWIVIATLIRPQGRRGELLADILTDFPERFAERKRLFLLQAGDNTSSREVSLEKHWLHKGRIVLKFSGVDSISDAEALRGLDVAIPLEERAPLDEETFYINDLIGCHLIDVSGGQRDAGEIIDVDRETGGAPLLIVRPADGKGDLLVPFAKAWLQQVDLDRKRIEMALPEGLFDINGPPSDEERRSLHAGE